MTAAPAALAGSAHDARIGVDVDRAGSADVVVPPEWLAGRLGDRVGRAGEWEKQCGEQGGREASVGCH